MGKRRYRERFDTEKVLNIANVITISRIILIPFFAEFVLQRRFDLAFIVFVLCGLSDGIDGALARLFKVRSRIGMLLDPIADKALMLTAFTLLGLMKEVPIWLVVTVISRDLIILTGSLFILIFMGVDGIFVVPSSKVNTVIQVLTIGFILFLLSFPARIEASGFEELMVAVKVSLFYLCEGTALYSGFRYLLAGFKLLSEI